MYREATPPEKDERESRRLAGSAKFACPVVDVPTLHPIVDSTHESGSPGRIKRRAAGAVVHQLSCVYSSSPLQYLFFSSIFCFCDEAGSIGSGSPRVMLGPGHVDVVPVVPDDPSKDPKDQVYGGWNEDPWSGTVTDDGTLHGRGAVGAFAANLPYR